MANSADDPCTSESASALSATVPGLVTARALNAQTNAQAGGATSTASVADVTITLGGNTINATVLQSQATGTCTGGIPFHPAPALSGSSRLVSLTINGTTYAVGDQPQTISVPGVITVYVNRQVTGSGSLTQRALEVSAPLLLTDVVVAESTADFTGNPCA